MFSGVGKPSEETQIDINTVSVPENMTSNDILIREVNRDKGYICKKSVRLDIRLYNLFIHNFHISLLWKSLDSKEKMFIILTPSWPFPRVAHPGNELSTRLLKGKS